MENHPETECLGHPGSQCWCKAPTPVFLQVPTPWLSLAVVSRTAAHGAVAQDVVRREPVRGQAVTGGRLGAGVAVRGGLN